MNKSTQSLDHARKVGELWEGQWTTLKAMGNTRWWSLFTLADSFWLNVQTLKYMRDTPRSDLVSGEMYNLTDADWKDIEIIRKITMVFKLSQENLDGEKYITGSLVVPIIEGIRSSAVPERMFSGAGHIMNKKRANLSPDPMDELVYLHEVRPTVREWEAVKRARH